MPVLLSRLAALPIGPADAQPAPDYDVSVSEGDVLEALNPEFPGIEAATEAYAAGDLVPAKQRPAEYLRGRTPTTSASTPGRSAGNTPIRTI